MKKLNNKEEIGLKCLKKYLNDENYKYFLVYETGSQLQSLATETSDVDFYVFYVPTKLELLTQNMEKGNFVKLENCEVKLIAIPELFHLIMKGDPNIIETFFQKPFMIGSYQDNKIMYDKLFKLSECLYENRNLLVYLSNGRFIRSCIWMMRSNTKKLRPSKRYIGNGTFGKTLFEYVKEYLYASKFLNQIEHKSHENLENIIFPNQKTLELLKNYKSIKKYNRKVRNDVFIKYNYKKLNQEYRFARNNHKFDSLSKKAKMLLDKLVEDTPVYY